MIQPVEAYDLAALRLALAGTAVVFVTTMFRLGIRDDGSEGLVRKPALGVLTALLPFAWFYVAGRYLLYVTRHVPGSQHWITWPVLALVLVFPVIPYLRFTDRRFQGGWGDSPGYFAARLVLVASYVVLVVELTKFYHLPLLGAFTRPVAGSLALTFGISLTALSFVLVLAAQLIDAERFKQAYRDDPYAERSHTLANLANLFATGCLGFLLWQVGQLIQPDLASPQLAVSHLVPDHVLSYVKNLF